MKTPPLALAAAVVYPSAMDEYARIARLYDPLVGPFLKAVYRAVARRAGLARGPVLDICCGTGAQAALLGRAGLRAVGVDLSEAMLAVARVRHPGLRLVRADAARLPFADGAFDAAVVSMALHEKPPDLRPVLLAEAWRVVRPGGVLLVADYVAPGSGWRTAAAVVERLAGKTHHALYRDFLAQGGLAGLLDRCGLGWTGREPLLLGTAGLFEVPRD